MSVAVVASVARVRERGEIRTVPVTTRLEYWKVVYERPFPNSNAGAIF